MKTEYEILDDLVASPRDRAVDDAIAAENRRYLARPEAERQAEAEREHAGIVTMALLRLLNPAAARAAYDAYVAELRAALAEWSAS